MARQPVLSPELLALHSSGVDALALKQQGSLSVISSSLPRTTPKVAMPTPMPPENQKKKLRRSPSSSPNSSKSSSPARRDRSGSTTPTNRKSEDNTPRATMTTTLVFSRSPLSQKSRKPLEPKLPPLVLNQDSNSGLTDYDTLLGVVAFSMKLANSKIGRKQKRPNLVKGAAKHKGLHVRWEE